MRKITTSLLAIALALSMTLLGAGSAAAVHETVEPSPSEPVVCDADADRSDGDAHAWCGATADCYPVVWGFEIGPVFVGGYYSCQAGIWYDESGSDDWKWIDT